MNTMRSVRLRRGVRMAALVAAAGAASIAVGMRSALQTVQWNSYDEFPSKLYDEKHRCTWYSAGRFGETVYRINTEIVEPDDDIGGMLTCFPEKVMANALDQRSARALQLARQDADNLVVFDSRFGWPFRCIRAVMAPRTSGSSVTIGSSCVFAAWNSPPSKWYATERQAALPLDVLWAGLAGNTVVYALGGAAIITGARHGARWYAGWKKRRVGLCRRCGYDVSASPERCPECGSVVA